MATAIDGDGLRRADGGDMTRDQWRRQYRRARLFRKAPPLDLAAMLSVDPRAWAATGPERDRLAVRAWLARDPVIRYILDGCPRP